MTELIKKSGKSIMYISEFANVASNKIAKNCGFVFIATEEFGYRSLS